MADSDEQTFDNDLQKLWDAGYWFKDGDGKTLGPLYRFSDDKGNIAAVGSEQKCDDISKLPQNIQDMAGGVQTLYMNTPAFKARLQAAVKQQSAKRGVQVASSGTKPSDAKPVFVSTNIQNGDLKGMASSVDTQLDYQALMLKSKGDMDGAAAVEEFRQHLNEKYLKFDAALTGMSDQDRKAAVEKLHAMTDALNQQIEKKTDPQTWADFYRNNCMPWVDDRAEDFGKWCKDTLHAVGDEASKLLQQAQDFMKDPAKGTQDALHTLGDAAKNFTSNLNAGKVVGGIGGLIAAFLVGGLFGNGPLKWVFTAMLAPLFLMLGTGKMGDSLNNWISGIFKGFNKDGNAPAQQPQVGQAYAQGQQQGYGQQQPAPMQPGQPGYVGPSQQPPFGQQLYAEGHFPQGYYYGGEFAPGYMPVAPVFRPIRPEPFREPCGRFEGSSIRISVHIR